jgi:hypothetical protein
MFDQQLQNERRDKSAILQALEEAGAKIVNPSKISCPFHDDTSPSAGIFDDGSGTWKFKCHGAACGWHGDVFDIRAKAAGKELRDVLPRSEQPVNRVARHMEPVNESKPVEVFPTKEAIISSARGCTEHYTYTNPADNKIDLLILRIERPGEKKQFRQCHFSNVHNGWVYGKPAGKMPVYNRGRIANSKIVIVVEGEKCVHALRAHGFTATTSPGGAATGNAERADWTPLAGKTVYLWPDNDEPDAKGLSGGAAHMLAVKGILETLSPRPMIYWIDPAITEVPPKGDCVEFIAQTPEGMDAKTSISCLLSIAKPMGPSSPLAQMIDDSISGKRANVPFPFPIITTASQALLPGSVTAFCGEAGAGKSFFLVQSAWHLCERDIPCAVFMLEDGPEFHLSRLLAQLENNIMILNAEWIRFNGDEAKDSYNRHREALDKFSLCLTTEPKEIPTYKIIVEWVDKKLAEGCRVLFIDPVTAATPTEKPWIEDHKFIMQMKQKAKDFGASILLSIHPKKNGKTGNGLDDMAGGSAIPRLSHAVIWLKRSENPEDVLIRHDDGSRSSVTINRRIEIFKARAGSGVGTKIGMSFESRTASFHECGIIMKD